jgi:type IX secretion system PorP/SprF family membrane protein
MIIIESKSQISDSDCWLHSRSTALVSALPELLVKKRIITFFLFLITAVISAQLTPVTNQYVLNPMTINPAYAGNRGALNIAAFYRRQWAGISKAPETMTLAMDLPLISSKLGLGLVITNNKYGVTRETQYCSNYAFKIEMSQGSLSFGFGAGLLATNTAWSDLKVVDPGDEYYLTDSRVYVVPAFSFGMYYARKRYFLGISIPKLLGSTFNVERNKYTADFDPGKYCYLLYSGYLFNLAPNLAFFPSTLVSYSHRENVLYDINAHFILYDRIWLGGSYRNDRSVGGLIQIGLNNQLKLAYTYDFDFGSLRSYSSGSHEIMLRYEFRFKVKVVNPLIF